MSTLGTIRGNVRAYLGEATPLLYANADLNRYISEAYQYYTNILIESGNAWFVTHTNLALTAGVESISLSSLTPTFVSVSNLYKNTQIGRQPLVPSRGRYEFVPTQYGVSGDYYFPMYDFMGNTLILRPAPLSSEAASSTSGLRLEYNYMPTFPAYNSADSFEFDTVFRVSWEPLVVLWATIAALEQKDASGGVSDISTFRSRLATLEAQFKESLEKTETPDHYEYDGYDYLAYY